MIKWLLVSAFLVNLLVFYWFSSQSARNFENKSNWEEPSAEIVLLSELKVIPPERALSVAAAEFKEGLEVVAKTYVEIDIEQSTVRESWGNKGGSLSQNEGSGVKAEPGEKVSLRGLVSELELRKEPKIASLGLESEAELPCVLLGRFDSERDAVGLSEKLEREVGVAAKLQMVVEGLDRYLIYIPPFETKIEAKLQQSILEKAGIKSSLYHKGRFKNGLSLGFFASKNNADQRYDSFLAAGYDVELNIIATQISRYWLELERHEQVKLSQLFWQDLAKEFPNVLSKPAECVMSREPKREKRAE